jgi:hypothetical protein
MLRAGHVPVEGGTVGCVWGVPSGFQPGATPALVLAHGAGNDMASPFVSFFHEGLASRGLLTVKFNFPYRQAGRKAPDRPSVLLETWRAVLGAVRGHRELRPGPLFIGGKSMGGRLAAELAAQGEAVAGLVFLGYPLHPARRPDDQRAARLYDLRHPMLFAQGTRDPLCDLATLRPVLARLPLAALYLVERGDHSLAPALRTGQTREAAWAAVADVVVRWVLGVAARAAGGAGSGNPSVRLRDPEVSD